MERGGQSHDNHSRPAAVALGTIKTWQEYYRDVFGPSSSNSLGGRSVCSASRRLNNKISLYSGNIANLQVDAVVNACQSEELFGTSGVTGAICTAAGPQLKETLDKSVATCEIGNAIITKGFRLPAHYIIHTSGPVWKSPGARSSTFLSSCYRNCLNLLVEKNCRSIAFPCISTGAKGYPSKDAAEIALREIRDFLEKNESKIERIVICVFLERDRVIYEELLPEFFPVNLRETFEHSYSLETERNQSSENNLDVEDTSRRMDEKLDYLSKEIAELRLAQQLMKIQRSKH